MSFDSVLSLSATAPLSSAEPAWAFSATCRATFLSVSRPAFWDSTLAVVWSDRRAMKVFHCSPDCFT